MCVCVPGESGVCVCMRAERLGLCTVRVRLSSRFQGHSVDDRALALPSLTYHKSDLYLLLYRPRRPPARGNNGSVSRVGAREGRVCGEVRWG